MCSVQPMSNDEEIEAQVDASKVHDQLINTSTKD
jgi:hypothetical protein